VPVLNSSRTCGSKIVLLADFVTVRRIEAVSTDPDDDNYIAAAIESRASFVVSGDPDLLDIKEHEGVRIVKPRVPGLAVTQTTAVASISTSAPGSMSPFTTTTDIAGKWRPTISR
jgi:hypothetical protein